MSNFLSDGQTGEIENMLTESIDSDVTPISDAPSEAPADVNQPEVQTQAEVEEPQTESKASPAPAADNADESSHRIPYSRFKDVNDAKNEYRNQAKSLRQQLEETQRQLEQFSAVPSQDEPEEEEWLDDYSRDQAAQTQRFDELSGRLHEFEVQQAGVTLAQEVAKAQDKYPGVPEQILYKAVVDNGDANLMEVAGQYYDFIEAIQQQAVERHLKENPNPEPQKVAPRPRRSGSSPSNLSRPAESERPKTLSDASAALRKHLKDNPLF
jgi:hypothetical protein